MVALSRMGENLAMEESAILFWFSFSNPQLIAESDRKNIPPEVFQQFASLPKRKFLDDFAEVWNSGLFGGSFTFITS